ncbi:uncharacterized protein LOC129003953 [Macrosteles quadrilineatus]|uniref:uncharacterized protein LOC129003953 n=1 Tax=Macrosteles quadrilineatus TaxID=74068 RepID=UPI0023E21B74|nr:uncharacterized protein LOC129003953 [Macrosteles quadrilineatus]
MVCRHILLSLVAVYVYASEYHSIVEKVVYKYPGKIRGDWELPECGTHSVCGVMRLRFWQSPTIYRLCRCVQGDECPWRWGNSTDQYSMPLDNRSQLKFCQRVTELGQCSDKRSGMVESSHYEGDVHNLTTDALCHCHWPAYWQLHRHYYRNLHNGTIDNINYFRCAKMGKCRVNEFCGHIVADTFSTYQRCSCPVGSLCLNRDRTIRNATELMYSGPTYRAYCLPLNP